MSSALYWPTASMTIAKGGEYNNDRGVNHSPRYHQGADIAIGVGTPIYGSGDGAVTAVINTGTKAGYGLYVKVRYVVAGVTFDIINAHMSRVDVRVGQSVSPRTQLGVSGGSRGSFGAGDATGPHDHLEVRRAGALANPSSYLNNRTALAGGSGTPISNPSIRKAPTMLLWRTTDGTIGLATDNGFTPIGAPSHVALFQRLFNSYPNYDTFNAAERDIMNGYIQAAAAGDRDTATILAALSKISVTVDPAPVVAAVTAAIAKTGVKVDDAAIAKAVETALADDFAGIPKGVLDAEAKRLEA